MNFFGFKIKTKEDRGEQKVSSVVTPTNTDGSIVLDNGLYGSAYNLAFDLDGQIKNELELIRRYRELANYPEVSEALEDIVNEAISVNPDEPVVTINMDSLNASPTIKKKIADSFNDICNLLEFNERGHEIFERWYIDGKIYYQVLIDVDNPKEGIQELREIDPRKIKKVKNIKKKQLPNGVEVIDDVEEFFLFNDKGMNNTTSNGIRLSVDSVVMASSGVIDQTNGLILSNLHKAIKPANQLKMLEDAVVIYRITRAPERRVFYIDVGGLPKGKAEQYVTDIMNKFKNKLTYDVHTGEVADAKRHLSMMEDFWMPRRDGGKGTEITTLPGGQGLAQLDDLDYFREKLYHSLNVPVSRMKPETGFSLGRSTEISRDEIKFAKFIDKQQSKFSQLLLSALRIQLIAKGVINSSDWENISQKIKIRFARDNYFSELKEIEILNNRAQAALQIDAMVGKYYSKDWVQKKILRMTDEEIEEIRANNEKDKKDNPEMFGLEPEQQNIPPEGSSNDANN
jgi:hypothetical protein